MYSGIKKMIIICSILVLCYCGKKDEMNKPHEIKQIKAGTNYLLEKIKYVGNVRWYSIDLKKGNRINAKIFASDKLGVQLHIDLMKEGGDKGVTVIQNGVDKGAASSVMSKVPEDGTYLLRVFDRGMDGKVDGILSGYTIYVSQ